MGQTFSGIGLGNWRETKPSLPEALPLKQGRISASFFQGAYNWAFSQNASHSLDSEITQDHPCAMAMRRKVAVHVYHIVAMAAQLREEVRSPGWTSTHGRSPKTCSPCPEAPDASKTPSTLSRCVRDNSSVPGGRSMEAAASAWGPGWARLLSSPPGYSSLCQLPACVPAAFLEGPCFNKAKHSWHADTRQDYRGAGLCCVHFHFNAASPRRLSLSKEDAAHWAIQSN